MEEDQCPGNIIDSSVESRPRDKGGRRSAASGWAVLGSACTRPRLIFFFFNRRRDANAFESTPGSHLRRSSSPQQRTVPTEPSRSVGVGVGPERPTKPSSVLLGSVAWPSSRDSRPVRLIIATLRTRRPSCSLDAARLAEESIGRRGLFAAIRRTVLVGRRARSMPH